MRMMIHRIRVACFVLLIFATIGLFVHSCMGLNAGEGWLWFIALAVGWATWVATLPRHVWEDKN